MGDLEEFENRVVELEAVIGAHRAGTIPEAVAEIDAKLSAMVTGDLRKLFDLCELVPCVLSLVRGEHGARRPHLAYLLRWQTCRIKN